MTAVDLKAPSWQHIDPSSIIFGPEMKEEEEKKINRVKTLSFFFFKAEFKKKKKIFCPILARRHLDALAFLRKSCRQLLKRVITGLPFLHVCLSSF